MKERIITGWTFQRWLYLVLGCIIMAQAVVEQQWLIILPAGYFAAMAVFNFGCAAGGCYGGACNTTRDRESDKESLNVDFEEIKKQ